MADRHDVFPYRRCGRSGLLLPAISLGACETFGGYDRCGPGRPPRQGVARQAVAGHPAESRAQASLQALRALAQQRGQTLRKWP